MTDRSPEDELIAEAVKFGRSFQHMLRAHAQAAHWLERRRIRKQISLALREQRRAEQTMRDHQLGWTQQMVERYRVHAATVAERAENPNIDHARRHRDSQILAEHSDYLRSKILDNSRLTLTERGIALDGLDAATVFPHLKTGRLFDRAHKVKGIDALHYRALVAREKTGQVHRGREIAPDQDQGRVVPRVRRPERFAAQLTWSDPRGWVWSEFGSARTEDGAAQWVHDNIARSDWTSGTTVELNITDTHDQSVSPYRDYGEPREVTGNLLAYTDARDRSISRDAAAVTAQDRRFTTIVRYHAPGDLDADQISVLRGFHDDRETSARWVHDTVGSLDIEPRTRVTATLWDKDAVQPSHVAAGTPSDVIEDIRQRWYRYAAQISYTPQGGDRAVHETRGHPSEAECADWTRAQLDAIRPAPGTLVQVGIYDGDRGDHDPVFRTEGPIGMVSDEIDALRAQHAHRNRGEQTRPAESSAAAGVDNSRIAQIERQLTDMAADRDRLASRVEILQRGLDAVTADRDEVKRCLGSADARIEELKNRNLRLANEIDELRERPTVEQVAAERDRYKGERDEAVAKLVRSTPEPDRYGSRSRSSNGSEHPSGDRPATPNREDSDADRFRDARASHEEARRDFDNLVRQNMTDALTDRYSEVIRRQVQAIEDRGRPIGAPQAAEFVRWWANGGAEEYWAEKRSRDQSQPEPADQRENTQPWRAEDLDTPRQRITQPERNGKRRNGIERSR
ncbi:hypothetical protein [Nocardia colli]|uniref:hypothetical protein n=1 Tax=Nocardia colli TaxID=2545717 RepID=UPI00168D37E5|nr:hypothetical protein [Nocardia colli]